MLSADALRAKTQQRVSQLIHSQSVIHGQGAFKKAAESAATTAEAKKLLKKVAVFGCGYQNVNGLLPKVLSGFGLETTDYNPENSTHHLRFFITRPELVITPSTIRNADAVLLCPAKLEEACAFIKIANQNPSVLFCMVQNGAFDCSTAMRQATAQNVVLTKPDFNYCGVAIDEHLTQKEMRMVAAVAPSV